MTDASGRAATTWAEVRAVAERRLAASGVANAVSEARWIVEEASGLVGAELVAADLDRCSVAAATRVDALTTRRVAGEPLQYVLGSWAFRGIDLFVDPRVLIPRPETEVTAGWAIEEATRSGARRGRRSAWTGTATDYVVADLGTGSGAIALALASELPDALVWATDASPDAVAVARANVAGLGGPGARVRVGHGDWFEALPSDLRRGIRTIVSNPPYLREDEVDDLPPEVARHEPQAALVSGPTGLEATAVLVREAREWLEPGGSLVIEVDARRARESASLAVDAGYAEVLVHDDLTGRPRVLVARGD